MDLPHWRLILFSVLNSFLACFVVGYNLSCMNIPRPAIEQFINASVHKHYGHFLAEAPLDSLFSFVIAMYNVGAIVGSLSVMLVANRFGRRFSHFVICSFSSIAGSLMQAVGIYIYSFELIIVGRFVTGFSSGMVTGVLPIYLTECSPDKHRGLVANMESMFITFGTLLGTIISLEQLLGKYSRLIYLLGLPIVPAILLFAIAPFFPETPKYLYIMKQDCTAALRSLIFYHGPNARVTEAFAEYQQESEMSVESIGLVGVMKNHNLRFPALLGILIMGSAMTTGILAIFNYSSQIFFDATHNRDIANYGTIIMSFANLCGAFGALLLIDRFGRRPLMIYGSIMITICNILFVIFYEIARAKNIPAISYVACVLVVVQVTIFNLGPGAVTWFFASEITPASARSVSSALSVTTNWLVSLILIQVFLVLDKAIHAYAFIVLFIGPSIVFLAMLWFWLPETKNRSVEEISVAWWRGPRPYGALSGAPSNDVIPSIDGGKQNVNNSFSPPPYMMDDSKPNDTGYGSF